MLIKIKHIFWPIEMSKLSLSLSGLIEFVENMVTLCNSLESEKRLATAEMWDFAPRLRYFGEILMGYIGP